MSNEGFLKFVRNNTEKDLVTVIQEETADNLTQSEADNLYLGKTEKASSASTADAVAWTGVSGKPSFATVATSGNYNDLSNKPNIPASLNTYVTQTWRSGNNWYRVWSNGFIEQGGRGTFNVWEASKVTISLHRAMTTNNYVISAIIDYGSMNPNYVRQIDSATTSNFIYNDFGFYGISSITVRWYVCGF